MPTCTTSAGGARKSNNQRILDYSYDAHGTVYMLKYRTSSTDSGTYYYYAHNTRGDVNCTYGMLGKSLGLSINESYLGSYVAAGLPTSDNDLANEMNDWKYITLGYSYKGF